MVRTMNDPMPYPLQWLPGLHRLGASQLPPCMTMLAMNTFVYMVTGMLRAARKFRNGLTKALEKKAMQIMLVMASVVARLVVVAWGSPMLKSSNVSLPEQPLTTELDTRFSMVMTAHGTRH